jgi:hypothetical protein
MSPKILSLLGGGRSQGNPAASPWALMFNRNGRTTIRTFCVVVKAHSSTAGAEPIVVYQRLVARYLLVA